MRRVRDALFERSIMLWLAAAILAVSAIGIGGMVISTLVVEQVQGSGSAINVAGSLRRLSHRMGSIVLSDAENDLTDHTLLQSAIVHFEATLNHQMLTDVLRRQPDNPAMATYRQVQETWRRSLKPKLAEQALAGPNLFPVETHNRLLLLIDEFVDQINTMVAQLEADTEQRISTLRAILWGAVALTILVLLIGLFMIHRRVLLPLDALLGGASRIGVGDFNARTHHTGRDELGRVGQAFNTMAEAVFRSHQDLEKRVREKTAELTRSNRSLALLYNAISQLHHAPTAPETYRAVLAELDGLLDLKGSMACLQAKHGGPASLLASSLPDCGDRGGEGCAECLSTVALVGGLKHYNATADGHELNLPLRDMDGTYGVMRLALPQGRYLGLWQEQLLEALIRHIGIALGMSRKLEQERLLALQEERSTIARELHDSIAQSLSYMKIQASLLQPVLSDPVRREQAETVLRDLREGITAAYRQLRELLATFRLKMESDFLTLLAAAVDEYASRGGLSIHLETRLEGCQLTPNQEIHTLQIMREALSNVLRHAHASQAWVRVVNGAGVEVEASVEDDGIGPAGEIDAIAEDTFHYGLTIMRERAQGLHGHLEVGPRPGGGTRVTLRFHAQPVQVQEVA
ncbi:MAG: type IV pili methyl-accepting chemotaxis transducer N-terminal domain-containing protein [Thiobacillus sp.]|nr:type IV pili methyl-accepting chemotaxis transducer N-terminal domain-containing protein [Thiobacillus sp.]